MTSCLSSKGSDKAAAGGREEGITPGGSTHADQKTGRQGILQPGAPEVAMKNQSSWVDLINVTGSLMIVVMMSLITNDKEMKNA